MNEALLLLCFLAQIPMLWAFVSILFTFIHAWEEVSGEGGPLWENFGCIVGVSLPGWLGFLLFTVLLPLGLMTLAPLGYWHGSLIAISLLLGARVGDTLFSHWGLCASGLSRPNPGIWSTTYYVAEAAVILCCFKVSLPWALAGAGFFLAVLPAIWLAGRVIPSWQHTCGGHR